MNDFCPFCKRSVSKWHQHWGPRFVWKFGQPPINHAKNVEGDG